MFTKIELGHFILSRLNTLFAADMSCCDLTYDPLTLKVCGTLCVM